MHHLRLATDWTAHGTTPQVIRQEAVDGHAIRSSYLSFGCGLSEIIH